MARVNTSAPQPVVKRAPFFRRTIPRWMVSFVGFPLGGLAAFLLVGPVDSVGSAAVGIGFMIGIPLFYGILGFVMGAIGALVYNALSGIIGGVKFELEGVQQEYAAPPPPQHWEPHQYPAQ